eukprot:6468102-Amphidinium_carterae.2
MPKAVPSTAPMLAGPGQDAASSTSPPAVLPPVPPSVEKARRQLSGLETVEEDEQGENAMSSPDVPRGRQTLHAPVADQPSNGPWFS